MKASKANVLAQYTTVSMHDLKYSIITTLWLQLPLLLCFKLDECSQHASKHLNSDFWLHAYRASPGSEIQLFPVCLATHVELASTWIPIFGCTPIGLYHDSKSSFCQSVWRHIFSFEGSHRSEAERSSALCDSASFGDDLPAAPRRSSCSFGSACISKICSSLQPFSGRRPSCATHTRKPQKNCH